MRATVDIRYHTEQLEANASAFAKEYDLTHIEDELRKGALVAQDPGGIY